LRIQGTQRPGRHRHLAEVESSLPMNTQRPWAARR
jgi:hypothetical protein